MNRRFNRPTHHIGHIERLEGRALMAADATATLSNGVLTITGTDRSDFISVVPTTSPNAGSTIVFSSGTRIGVFPTASIRSIAATLGDGNDMFDIRHNASFDNVTIRMGGGSAENCSIFGGSFGTLTVDAVASVGTGLRISGTVVRGSAQIDFGEGVGNDRATISGCQIGNLSARFGDGDDLLILNNSSSIAAANVRMGAGMDSCTIDTNSEVQSGMIDGGSNPSGPPRRVDSLSSRRVTTIAFINWETTRWLG